MWGEGKSNIIMIYNEDSKEPVHCLKITLFIKLKKFLQSKPDASKTLPTDSYSNKVENSAKISTAKKKERKDIQVTES